MAKGGRPWGRAPSDERRDARAWIAAIRGTTGSHQTSEAPVSPSASRIASEQRTVHDPLESHGSRCSAVARTALPRPPTPPVSSWPAAKAEQRSPFAPAPLQGLRRCSGLLRPCASLRYSRPRGWSRLRLVPSRRQRDEAQVLTFHTKAWSSFAPPTCRMPLGQYQGIPRANPGGRVTPGSDIA